MQQPHRPLAITGDGLCRDSVPQFAATTDQDQTKEPNDRYTTGLDLAADLAVIFDDLETIHDESALKEKFNTVKNLGFFREFLDSEIWELIRASDWQSYPKDTLIIREGDRKQSF